MLTPATDADFAALIAGKAPPPLLIADGGLDDPAILVMLRAIAAKVGARIQPAAWMMIEDGEIVGLCSITRPPSPEGVAEIGYGVAASRRGRGIAGRAVADLLAWARREPRLTAIMAETAVDNIPSQGVLARNGFQQVGTRTDPDDGALICWRISVA